MIALNTLISIFSKKDYVQENMKAGDLGPDVVWVSELLWMSEGGVFPVNEH